MFGGAKHFETPLWLYSPGKEGLGLGSSGRLYSVLWSVVYLIIVLMYYTGWTAILATP